MLMKPSKHHTISSMKDLYKAVADHVTGADIVRADEESAKQAQQRAHIRVANLRERFQAIRELSESLNDRIDEFKRRRAGYAAPRTIAGTVQAIPAQPGSRHPFRPGGICAIVRACGPIPSAGVNPDTSSL